MDGFAHHEKGKEGEEVDGGWWVVGRGRTVVKIAHRLKIHNVIKYSGSFGTI